MSDSIDIVISDKVDNSISTKLDSIAASAELADNALTRLKSSLALINTSPLKVLQDAANAATTAIDKNALANQRLATETAKTATAQQNTATATANTAKAQELAATAAQKLATETQRTATATAQAAAAQDRAALAAKRLEDAQNGASMAAHGHGLSVGKMALSMAAGMIIAEAFTLILRGVRAATLGSIEAIDEFQQSGIQMAAILTSLAKDQTDIPGTYQQARAYAEQLNGTLQKVDANTSLNLQNLQSISQEMAKQGVTLDTTNKTQVENYTKIANAVAVYSRNGKDERQVRQEVAALMKGEVKQGDELAKLVDRITNGHLKDLITQWKRVGVETGNQGYAIDKLGQALSGFGPASEELKGTWSAVTSSISTAVNMLQRAFFKDIFGDVTESGETFANWLKENEKTVNGWGRNFLKVIYNISAEIIRMNMLLDKAGGTASSAQMLLYGPGKALGVKSSTERFDNAAKNNMEYEERYKEKEKMLDALAIKMNALDALDNKIAPKVNAPKLGTNGPTAAEIAAAAKETEKQWRAYSSAFDALNQKIEENNPNLTKYQRELGAIDAEVNRAIFAAPMYADALRVQGEQVKESIRLKELDRIATAKLKGEIKELEDVTKHIAGDFAPFSKNGNRKVGMAETLMPDNPFTFTPNKNKDFTANKPGLPEWAAKPMGRNYSLTGAAESGFSQVVPSAEQLQREAERSLAVKNRFDAIMASGKPFQQQLLNLEKFREEQIAEVKKWDETEIGMAEKKALAIAKINQDHVENKKNLDIEYRNTTISAATQLGSQLASVLMKGNKRQFEIGKALAESMAVVDGSMAVIKALASAPPPYNAILAGITAGAVALQIGMIQSQQYQGYQAGGYTGNFGLSEVAGVVHGQEFVMNASATARNRDLLEAMNRGGTPVVSGGSGSKASRTGINVSINNYGTSKAFEVQQISETEVRVIARDEAKNAVYTHAPKVVASEIRNPNSTVSKSLDRSTQTQRRR